MIYSKQREIYELKIALKTRNLQKYPNRIFAASQQALFVTYVQPRSKRDELCKLGHGDWQQHIKQQRQGGRTNNFQRGLKFKLQCIYLGCRFSLLGDDADWDEKQWLWLAAGTRA